MYLSKCVILLSVLFLNIINGYKILVFFPYPGKSHTILGNGYVKHLMNAGHNVTYVTPIPIKNPAPNLTQVDVSSNFGKHPVLDAYMDIKKVISGDVQAANVDLIYQIFHEIAVLAVMHENVQKLLMDPRESFDAVIVEWLYSDLYSGIAAVFNCPYIWSSSMEPHAMVLRLIDQFPNPAYIPDLLSFINPPFTFTDRVRELWSLITVYRTRWNMIDIENQTWKEAFGPASAVRGRELPSFNDVRFNASLMFGNSHVSAGLPVTLPQNYKPVGGYHIDRTVMPLPDNLQQIMDNSPNGVIYFSLGTMMKSTTLPDALKKGFLKVFGELKQTIIWKFEEKLPNLPENVHIVDWAPQQSILAHPKTILFITHGGLLSTTESIHFGVPIIGIPLFADQYINIKRAVAKGFGSQVTIAYDADVKLKKAIQDVLGNAKYRQRVKELSFIYHDRPATPGTELVHWTEHVIKTGGAPHLRSVALMMPWYQKIYLDLIAVIIFVLFGVVVALKRILLIVRGNRKVKQS